MMLHSSAARGCQHKETKTHTLFRKIRLRNEHGDNDSDKLVFHRRSQRASAESEGGDETNVLRGDEIEKGLGIKISGKS